MQLPCTEDVNTCVDSCMKKLECNLHKCSKKCHFGSCEKCLHVSWAILLYLYLVTLNILGDSFFVIILLFFLQVVEKTCRCGKKRKTIPCSQQMTCETKCSRTRNCGRHPCKKKVYFVKKMLEIYQCYQTSRNAWKIYEKVHSKQTLIRLKS